MNHEEKYSISFDVYDRDTWSSNDFVAQATLPLSDLVQNAPSPDPETGLYKLADPWRDHDAGRPKTNRHDSNLGRILSRPSSSTKLSKAKGNGNGKSGAATLSQVDLSSSSTLELTRSLSPSLSDISGIYHLRDDL
jgi:phosphatidylserine decarboxylase